MPTTKSYPFSPRSTAGLIPGEYWAVPLPDSRFACGRILQLNGSELPSKSRNFLAGLEDWIGDSPPTAADIAGKAIIASGIVHIRAITESGGAVLGHRRLEDDEIVMPMLLSCMAGIGNSVLSGADAVRPATHEDQGKFPVLSVWGFAFIRQLAIARLIRKI
jgi:hypothetical protein